MTAPEALAELRRAGGRLVWRDGDRLVVEAPAGALSPERAAALRRRKEELVELLRAEADAAFYHAHKQERLGLLLDPRPTDTANELTIRQVPVYLQLYDRSPPTTPPIPLEKPLHCGIVAAGGG